MTEDRYALQGATFLTIAPELRYKVYTILFSGGIVSIDPYGRMDFREEPCRSNETDLLLRQATAKSSKIQQVCCKVHIEAAPIFYNLVELQTWDMGHNHRFDKTHDPRVRHLQRITLIDNRTFRRVAEGIIYFRRIKHLAIHLGWNFWEPSELGMNIKALVVNGGTRYHVGADDIVNVPKVAAWAHNPAKVIGTIRKGLRIGDGSGQDSSVCVTWDEYEFSHEEAKFRAMPGSPTFRLITSDGKDFVVKYTLQGKAYEAKQRPFTAAIEENE